MENIKREITIPRQKRKYREREMEFLLPALMSRLSGYRKMKALIGTGASISLMSSRAYRRRLRVKRTLREADLATCQADSSNIAVDVKICQPNRSGWCEGNSPVVYGPRAVYWTNPGKGLVEGPETTAKIWTSNVNDR